MSNTQRQFTDTFNMSEFAKQLELELKERQLPPQRLYAHPLRYPHVWFQLLTLACLSVLGTFSFVDRTLFESVFFLGFWACIFGLVFSCAADIRLFSSSDKPQEPTLTALQRRHGVHIVGDRKPAA